VNGYSQRQGVDYEEVFAPVARIEAVRLVIAWATNQGWEVHHLDVKSNFVIPRSEITETKPPYVCPGYLIHTYSNNMINKCHI
jgi:hypothetical protein